MMPASEALRISVCPRSSDERLFSRQRGAGARERQIRRLGYIDGLPADRPTPTYSGLSPRRAALPRSGTGAAIARNPTSGALWPSQALHRRREGITVPWASRPRRGPQYVAVVHLRGYAFFLVSVRACRRGGVPLYQCCTQRPASHCWGSALDHHTLPAEPLLGSASG